MRGVPAFVDDIVVIDDGSIDGTSGIGRSTDDQRITVVRHETNRGVGAAIATGYCRALELGMDVVVVMAGDGQMDPRDLAGLVAPVATGAADYAKGNRLRHPAVLRVMPWARLIGNIVLSALTRAATGLRHIGDSQCGYTAIHRRVLAVLDPRAMWARYGYPNHLLGALARHSFRVVDVPVRPVYAGELSGLRLRDALGDDSADSGAHRDRARLAFWQSHTRSGRFCANFNARRGPTTRVARRAAIMTTHDMPAGEITALLGRGTEFTGKLAFDGKVRIDGTFRGEIFSDGHVDRRRDGRGLRAKST